jgi:hypothetical protein
MAESSAAYQHARDLAGETASRLQQAVTRTAHPVPTAIDGLTPCRNPDIARVRDLFSTPRSARQAMLATLILAPPKALQHECQPG